MKHLDDRGWQIIRDSRKSDTDVVHYAVAWAEGRTISRLVSEVDDEVWTISPWRSPVYGRQRLDLAAVLDMLREGK